MKKFVPEFIKAKQELMKYFGCTEDYFIKPATNCTWHIKEIEGMYFINYYKDNENPNESVMVKKDGEPVVYKTDEYTMVVCVECVKIGLIFKNENEV